MGWNRSSSHDGKYYKNFTSKFANPDQFHPRTSLALHACQSIHETSQPRSSQQLCVKRRDFRPNISPTFETDGTYLTPRITIVNYSITREQGQVLRLWFCRSIDLNFSTEAEKFHGGTNTPLWVDVIRHEPVHVLFNHLRKLRLRGKIFSTPPEILCRNLRTTSWTLLRPIKIRCELIIVRAVVESTNILGAE